MGQGKSTLAHLREDRTRDYQVSFGVKNPMFDEPHAFAAITRLRRRNGHHHLDDESSELIEVCSLFCVCCATSPTYLGC